ncbi:deoxyribose-phosphate aldolase [Parageobacillus genomosp. 1]|jgi:deoxyribose-phosphate aldolase|uniref:Deoxyribose-phosphate aldolase n=1 Tax=Parageobacillus genomosp. 1 TaxID=1295642 RepID=A0ABC9VCZ4_9BACL|nr:deoxyribose-phosphate aldolase [Parageobacillus genomosp. 1]EZP76201.1 deoxyribose-phosphate aldolase [Parageobacillus genomosp. 1]
MENNIAKMIDHTLLKADTTKAQIVKLCEEAKQYGFASVCVNPTWVATAAELLKGTDVKVCTVIGFPLGANTPETKAFETKNAIENGAAEVDTVINIGALKDGNDELVERDIRAVVDAAKGKALVKVIIEACLLTEEEKVRACQLAVKAGADYVKTSTGFSTGGATVEDVALMRKTVGPSIGVKASGGVRDMQSANAMIQAGATRIGTSSGVAIVEGKIARSDY